MNLSIKKWEIVIAIVLAIPMEAFHRPHSAQAESPEFTQTSQTNIAASEQTAENTLDSSLFGSEQQNQLSPAFKVGEINVIGSTLLSTAELDSITQPIQGQKTTLTDLNQAADAITRLYLARGFATSRAILPTQQLENNGTVTLEVIEGWLGDIQVNGNQQLQSRYIQSRLRLAAGSPLNLQKLEAQIRLLKTDPLLEDIDASLKAGDQPGESILVVNLKEAKRISQSVRSDNYSSADGLPDRTQLSALYRNPSGIGDELSLSYSLRSSQNIQDESLNAPNYNIAYRVPVNANDGTLQLSASLDDRLVGNSTFVDLGLRSRDEVYAISYRQPIVKSLQQELAVSLGFSARRRQTFLFEEVPFPFDSSASTEGITQTRVLQIGQDYRRQDPSGAWSASSVANIGLGILDATTQSDLTPDGQFFSWQLQGQRVQRLGKDNLLIAQGNLQLSPNSLLSSEQFNLGGGQSVRGFRQNARSADNGWRLSLEGRFPVIQSADQRPILQLAPFVDAGSTWNNTNNPVGPVSQGFLAGTGLGLLWQPSQGIGIRLDYGVPLVNLSDRSNGFQDSGFYFSVISAN